MSNKSYDNNYYIERYERTKIAAEIIVPIIIDLFNPSSVIDYGCANGIWLSEFIASGISEIIGIDGHMVNRELLKIPEDSFLLHDLEKPFQPQHKYDVAISLEVAEHLDISKSDIYINSLTNSSDIIIFSAAIPYQGGTNHKNEQWPEYWIRKFSEHGFFVLDLIRNIIWTNRLIPVWYRQNIFCFIKESLQEVYKKENLRSEYLHNEKISVVHPDLYMVKIRQIENLENRTKFKNIFLKIKKIFD